MISPTLRLADGRRNCFRRAGWIVNRLAIVLALAGTASADIQQGDPPGGREEKEKNSPQQNIRRAVEIPTPQDASITVLRGVPTRITLSSTTAVRQPVIFRLGELPAHGVLSEPRPSPDGNTKAVVTYTAGPGTAASDSFTFRVRHRETATSGSATVSLRIVDPAAELEVPGELDFGEAVVGQSAIRPLVLINRGTAAFSAPLRLEPPWRLMLESPTVRVEAGGRVEVRVSYEPLAPGEASAKLEFPGVAAVATRLKGRAVAPVRLQPSLVQLAWDPLSRTRRAVATLTNRLDTPVDFTLASTPRLTFSEERGTLPIGGTREITISVPLPDAADLQSLLAVVARGVRDEVPLTAPPTPPLLALRDPDGWRRDGTALELAEGASDGSLVFANDGGESGILIITLPAGWSSPGLENATSLGPRESRQLLLVPPTPRPTAATGRLDVRLQDEQLVLDLTAPATPAPAAAAATLGPDALLTAVPSGLRVGEQGGLTAEQQQLQIMIDTLGIFPHDTRFDRSLPELPAITLGEIKPDRIEFSLKSVGPDFSYVVFKDVYRPPPGSRRPTRHWLPIEALRWKSSGDTRSSSLDGLAPGGRILLRFAVRTPDGRVGTPSNPIAITTPTPKPNRWSWIVGGGVLAAAGWWWRRRHLRAA